MSPARPEESASRRRAGRSMAERTGGAGRAGRSRRDPLAEGAPTTYDLAAPNVVGEAMAPGEAADAPNAGPPGGPRGRSPLNAVRDLAAALGPVGWVPLLVLAGLSAVERFDATAFAVLGPEIRDTFHLSNGGFTTIATFSLVLPILLAVPIGYGGDRYNRVRLSARGAFHDRCAQLHLHCQRPERATRNWFRSICLAHPLRIQRRGGDRACCGLRSCRAGERTDGCGRSGRTPAATR